MPSGISVGSARERERLEVRNREDEEAATAAADGGVDFVEIAGEEFLLLGTARV